MQQRLKVFTFTSGHGETIVDPRYEDHINQWLAGTQGELVHVTQSESDRPGGGHHVTLCLWYIPSEERPSRGPA